MLTQAAMEQLTDLVSATEHHARTINIHDMQGQITATLLKELTVSVKQLQLEVVSLGQQLHNRDVG